MLGGLLRARSRFPQIVENIEKGKQGKEFLEHPNALAKQVLSQLSSSYSWFVSKLFVFRG